VPIQAQTLTTAVQVSNAFNTTCAVTSGGSVSCWGTAEQGQVGIGSPHTLKYPSPQKVKSFE
jgi:alpha-tubulin suppressor-like RCC1 family protein